MPIRVERKKLRPPVGMGKYQGNKRLISCGVLLLLPSQTWVQSTACCEGSDNCSDGSYECTPPETQLEGSAALGLSSSSPVCELLWCKLFCRVGFLQSQILGSTCSTGALQGRGQQRDQDMGKAASRCSVTLRQGSGGQVWAINCTK